MRYLILFSILFLSFQGTAAPFPATSTSALTDLNKGLYFLHRGFTLSVADTDWRPLAKTEESLADSIRFASKENADGSLSVRIDYLSQNTTLELYSRKWMRDYPSYGFEVASAKTIQLNGHPTLVVDMYARSKEKQIRQVISKNNDRVVIMTCIDNKASFNNTLKECNKIIKSLAWVEEKNPTTPAATPKTAPGETL